MRSLRVPYPLNGLPLPGVSHCSLALYVLLYTTNGKWAKSLFTGRINKNPSCDFSIMTELGLVDDNRVSPALEKNNYFVREKDKDLKFLLVFLYELF